MHTTGKIAVAGATGRVGRHIVDVLNERRLDVVPIARAAGVDVISGDGLAAALAGVQCVIDASTGPSAEEEPATEFFTTAARNLHEIGRDAGVERMLTVSIIGTDRFAGGYGKAKIAHEHAALAGPLATRIVRAAQFHEFVEQLVQWGTQGDVAYVQQMRTQSVAARAVAEFLVNVATAPWPDAPNGATPPLEIAGPREEQLVELAQLLVATRGGPRIEGVQDDSDPNQAAYDNGDLLPGPNAVLAGPTFENWLRAGY